MKKLHSILCLSLLSLVSVGCKEKENECICTGSTRTDGKFTLTFDLGYGNYSVYLAAGEKITYPDKPNKDGLIFSSWSEDLDVMPEDNITIKAVYSNLFELGSYPQSQVYRTKEENSSLIKSLEEGLQVPEFITDPETEEVSLNINGWKDYGYYDAGQVSSYQFYVDKEVNGQKYRGVYLTNYRPGTTAAIANAANSSVDEFYSTNVIYWFKYDSVKWIIHRTDKGEVLASVYNVALDCQSFHSDLLERKLDSSGVMHYSTDEDYADIEGTIIHPNNYKYSTIRKWLNGFFFDTCFSNEEKAKVIKHEVNNDYSTDSFNVMYVDNYYNHYCLNQEGMEDYLFLPSVNDLAPDNNYTSVDTWNTGNWKDFKVTDVSEYGLTSNIHAKDTSQNAYAWLLRTPSVGGGKQSYIFRRQASQSYWYSDIIGVTDVNQTNIVVKPFGYFKL